MAHRQTASVPTATRGRPSSVGLVCPACAGQFREPLSKHIKTEHGEPALKEAVLQDKLAGMSDTNLGAKYGITFRYLERIITEATGTNISLLSPGKRITSWRPKDFRPETTTVWTFRSRGNWATDDWRDRGKWRFAYGGGTYG